MEDNQFSYHLLKIVSELESRIAGRVLSLLMEQTNVLGWKPAREEKLLKDKEICAYLQISISKFHQTKRKFKDFPVINIDGAKRYKASEVEDFFKNIKK